MSIDNEARLLLFRAMVGEAPIPTQAAIAQAQEYLCGNPAFCAALDEVVSIILINQRTMGKAEEKADWHARLQAYIAAQLDGRAYIHEFADVRRALDASVALAEEYALLYETMEREWLGTLPAPVDIPPLNLSALDLPFPAVPLFDTATRVTPLSAPCAEEVIAQPRPVISLPSLEKRWFDPLQSAWQTLCNSRGFDKLAPVLQPVIACFLMIACVAGLWLTTHHRVTNSMATPTEHVETVKSEDEFFKMQIQLETPFPPIIITTQSGPADDADAGCHLFHVNVKNICKL